MMSVSQMPLIALRKASPLYNRNADCLASRSRVDKGILNNALLSITSTAESNGLTSEQIGRLIDVLVLPEGLDRGTAHSLVKSLYPAGKVEEDIAVKVVGCLGLGAQRAPLQTQVDLINFTF